MAYIGVDPSVDSTIRVFANCTLQYVSASTVRLNRTNGKYLFINGVNQIIPAAGVDLANTALGANDTTYYVYAYMSGSTMTLEASATAYTQDSTYGHMIKTADQTRSLVGMVRKNNGNFLYSGAIKFVSSYYNRRPIPLNFQASAVGFTSTSFASYDTSTGHIHFLVWTGDCIHATGVLSAYQTAGSPTYFGIALYMDGVAVTSGTYSAIGGAANGSTTQVYAGSPTEGYRYVTAYSAVDTGTITFQAGSGVTGIVQG